MIPRDTIDQVREATDIVEIVGQYLTLKKRGKNFVAKCPFHTEKTPSFNVSPNRQMYHCFGCGVSGNVFNFLMEHEKMTFVEAARDLARRANITIRESGTAPQREQLERLNYSHGVAVEYYRSQLQKSKYSKVLNDYLKKRRRITDEAIDEFQLGLAGEEWDGLIKYAGERDLSPRDLEAAGLAILSERTGSHFDRFRQRLMIPIFNLSGKPIAFGGRTLKKGEPAKYINSPETTLYSKSNVLYGLNYAKTAIRENGRVYVVEGYFDVISLWQIGVRNVVASSGTAFTPQQARLLARFAETVYLFFDADSAGQQAAIRSVDALYDAGLDVRCMVSPPGEDPDTIARIQGHEAIGKMTSEALDYISYRLRGLEVRSMGLIAREKLIKELASVAARITDPVRRSLFTEQVASAMNVAVELVAGQVKSTKGPAEAGVPRKGLQASKVEKAFLSLLLQARGSLTKTLEKVSPEDFDSKKLSRLYQAMVAQHNVEGELNAQMLMETFEDDMREVVGELAMIEWDKDRVSAELREHTEQMVQQHKRRIVDGLKDDLAKAEAAGDQEKADQIMQRISSYGL